MADGWVTVGETYSCERVGVNEAEKDGVSDGVSETDGVWLIVLVNACDNVGVSDADGVWLTLGVSDGVSETDGVKLADGLADSESDGVKLADRLADSESDGVKLTDRDGVKEALNVAVQLATSSQG